MAEWLIRVIGKERKEIDKDLLVQAVLALGRQLAEQNRAGQQAMPDEGNAVAGDGA